MTTSDIAAGWVPPACTLPTVELPQRIAEFDELFATALRSQQRMTPTRLRLLLDPAAEERARDLATRETTCCSFFTFTFTPAAEVLQLDVGVPTAYVEVLDAVAAQANAAAGISA